MKKLMFALAAASLVGLAHAAAANWKYTAANIYNGGGESAAKYSGNAYIFDAKTITQSQLFDAFLSDTKFDVTQQSGYLGDGTVVGGTINGNNAANQFSAFEQNSGTHNFFFVLIDGDKIYLSATKTASAGSTDTALSIAFGSQAAKSKLSDFGYQGTGTWSVVPEPTSGLMLLLGLAGLALRRKQV